MSNRRYAALTTAFLSAFFLAACGDAESTDTRQWYTKAPIEDPGLTISPEVPSEMAELGDPDLMGVGAPEEEAAEEAQPPAPEEGTAEDDTEPETDGEAEGI